MIRYSSAVLTAAFSLTTALFPVVYTQAAAHKTRHHHTLSTDVSRHSSYTRSLPSRGITTEIRQPATLVGSLGVVTTAQSTIFGGQERGYHPISTVTKGQNLAICGETNTQYAVMMIDHSMGLISKADVQLLQGYQVVTNPTAPVGTEVPPQTGDTAAGEAGGPLGQRLIQTAYNYLGVPYVWGGDTRDGIDCSGFVKAVYASNGMALPRVSGDQATVGYDVPKSDVSQWIPGDRVYFACSHARIDHTGMYIGKGLFIHASVGHNHQVAIDNISSPFYWNHLVAVRRSKELEAEQTAGTQLTSSNSSFDTEANQQ